MLDTPGFHHLHLNSTDPDAAIDFYTRAFPTTSRTRWGGLPALTSPNNVLMLFERVAAPPPTRRRPRSGTSAGTCSTRRPRATASRQTASAFLPLYTGDGGGTVLISSDTWPGPTACWDARWSKSKKRRRPACSPPASAASVTSRVPTTPSSSMPATNRRSASTTCTCGRRTPSAPSSGTRRTSTPR